MAVLTALLVLSMRVFDQITVAIDQAFDCGLMQIIRPTTRRRLWSGWSQADYVMNDILLFIATLPMSVVYAVTGGIGGMLGGLVGYLAQKYFGVGKAWRFIPVVIFVVISFNLSQWLYREAGSLEAISALRQSRLVGVIFKYHPEAEREYTARFEKILSGPAEQVSDSSLALGAEIGNRYINLHTITASDAAIHHLLQTQASIMESLKNNPTACVAQYLGTRTASAYEGVPRSLFSEELNALADIIESSAVAPSPPPKANIDDVVRIVTATYRTNGYDIAEIAKIGEVQSLPPTEGCQVSYRFVSALASMNEKQSSFVYKGLLSAAK